MKSKAKRQKGALERRTADVALYRAIIAGGSERRRRRGAVVTVRAAKAKLAAAERDVAALRAALQLEVRP